MSDISDYDNYLNYHDNTQFRKFSRSDFESSLEVISIHRK
jgi:hypothetical protein